MDDPCAGWWLDFDNADVDFRIRDPKKQKFMKHSLTSFQGFTQLQIAFENGSSKVEYLSGPNPVTFWPDFELKSILKKY